MTKSLILTSTGLQNLNINDEDYFYFKIGKQEIKLHKFIAEFLSPKVSKICRADPTINNFIYENLIITKTKQLNLEDMITSDIISKLYQLSKGLPIELNEDESFKMCILSIILENEELFDLINNLFYKNSYKIDNLIDQLQLFYYFSHQAYDFNYSNIIKIISSNFYSIDKQKLLQLPKCILYEIISNENLKLETEDSLFDFIQLIFRNNDENDEDENFEIVDFYEQLDFTALSSFKFKDFLTIFDSNLLTKSLWNKLVNFIFLSLDTEQQNVQQNGQQQNQFKKLGKLSINSQRYVQYNQYPQQQQQHQQQQFVQQSEMNQQQQQQHLYQPSNFMFNQQQQQQQVPQLAQYSQPYPPPINPYQTSQSSFPNSSGQQQYYNIEQQIPFSTFATQQPNNNINQLQQSYHFTNIQDDDDEDNLIVENFLNTKNLSEEEKRIFIRYHKQRRSIDLNTLYQLFEFVGRHDATFRSLLDSMYNT